MEGKNMTDRKNKIFGERKRPELHMNKKAVIIFLIVLFAAVAVVWAVFVALKKQESTGIGEGAYYYAIDEKASIPDGSILRRKDDVTRVENDGHEYSLTGSMIYEDKGKTMLFQGDMLWYDMNTDSMKRIPYFSRMGRDGSKFTVKKGHSEKQVSGGFLYDNGDLYVLLEDAQLSYGEETINLDAGTVISCALSGDVQIVAGDGSCTYLEQPGQQLAVTFGNGCVLNPLADTYYQTNGTWRILFTTPSMVPELS